MALQKSSLVDGSEMNWLSSSNKTILELPAVLTENILALDCEISISVASNSFEKFFEFCLLYKLERKCHFFNLAIFGLSFKITLLNTSSGKSAAIISHESLLENLLSRIFNS